MCGKNPLTKDEIGIVKKLIDPNTKDYYCISCFSDYLGCDVQDLLDKIEDFKDDGCKLFE